MNAETIGQRIARLRKAQNLTQRELAERSGLSWGYLRQLETSRRMPGTPVCDALATALNVSLDELIRGTSPNAVESTLSTSEPADARRVEAVA